MVHRVFLLCRLLKTLIRETLFEYQKGVNFNLNLSKVVLLNEANDSSFIKPTQGGPGSHTSQTDEYLKSNILRYLKQKPIFLTIKESWCSVN